MDVILVLTHFDSLHCVLTVISRCKSDKKAFFNAVFPLPHTCHFETRPSPLSKIGGKEEMHLVRTFASSIAKTSTVTPIFYMTILITTILPFNEKKNWHKSVFIFFF